MQWVGLDGGARFAAATPKNEKLNVNQLQKLQKTKGALF